MTKSIALILSLILSLMLYGCSMFKTDKQFTLKIYDPYIRKQKPGGRYGIYSYQRDFVSFKTEIAKAGGIVIKNEDEGEAKDGALFITKNFYGTKFKVWVEGEDFTVEVWKEGEMIDKEEFEGYKKTEREYR